MRLLTPSGHLVTPSRWLTFSDVLLVPHYSDVASRSNVDLSTKLGPFTFKIPIVSANMSCVTDSEMVLAMQKVGGLGILHRFMDIGLQAEKVSALSTTGITGFSVGIGDEGKARLKATMDAFPVEDNLIVTIDIAHGHSESMRDMIQHIKKEYPGLTIIAGNVATAGGASDLEEWGADIVKVGVGGGSACTSRIVAGHGVSQLAAVDLATNAVSVPIISDGGHQTSGDAVKSLAVGAKAVMLGRLLAGYRESPGAVITRDDKQYMAYHGMASRSAQLRHKGKVSGAPEGVEAEVPYKNCSVTEFIEEFCAGIRSGCSYSGANNLTELEQEAIFIEITQSGLVESRPHALL